MSRYHLITGSTGNIGARQTVDLLKDCPADRVVQLVRGSSDYHAWCGASGFAAADDWQLGHSEWLRLSRIAQRQCSLCSYQIIRQTVTEYCIDILDLVRYAVVIHAHATINHGHRELAIPATGPLSAPKSANS